MRLALGWLSGNKVWFILTSFFSVWCDHLYLNEVKLWKSSNKLNCAALCSNFSHEALHAWRTKFWELVNACKYLKGSSSNSQSLSPRVLINIIGYGAPSPWLALESCMIDNLSILRFSSIGWSGEGCYVKSTDAHQTECTCNHLTHFAVLLDTSSGTETADISEVSVTTTPATPLYDNICLYIQTNTYYFNILVFKVE